MTEERWIVIVGWETFQHPDAGRSSTPPWIKDATAQLSKDEYRDLSGHLRGVLHDLRLEYARSHRQLRDSTVSLYRRLGFRVSRRDLESLNHAGFIEFSASNPASNPASMVASLEKSREEPPLPPLVEKPKTTKRKGVTGYRMVRGQGGVSYVRDPDGRDKPPKSYAIGAEPEVQLLPLAVLLETWIRNAGCLYDDAAIAEEIENREKRRGETLSEPERDRLLELATELRKKDAA